MLESTVDKSAIIVWHNAIKNLNSQAEKNSLDISLDILGNVLEKNRGDTTVFLKDFIAAGERVGSVSNVSFLFWQMGLSFDLAALGSIGIIMQSTKNLGEALYHLQKYFYLIQDATALTVTVEDDKVAVCYNILDKTIWPRVRDSEFTMGILYGVIHEYVGNEIEQVNIHYEHEKKADNYADISSQKCKTFFGSDVNMICFPLSFLDCRKNSALLNRPESSYHYKKINEHILDYNYHKPISIKVQNQVLFSLNKGYVEKQKNIANNLAMTTRTMHRKLSDEGVSFRDIVSDCRKGWAVFELHVRQNKSLNEIASLLGYSEHSAFTRAFSGWLGTNPKSYLLRNPEN